MPRRLTQLPITTDLLVTWLGDGILGYLQVSGNLPTDRPKPGLPRSVDTAQGLSVSSSVRTVSMSEVMRSSPKSKRMPAAANSSGRGREPPSAGAFLSVLSDDGAYPRT
jgi:hypothetical protein